MAMNRYILTPEQSRRIERLLRSDSSPRGRMRRRQPTSTAAYIQTGFQPRLAYCSEDAPTGNTIDCTLDSTSGEPISVTCSIAGGNNLSDAFPLLADGTLLPIMYNPTTGAAVAMTVFQTFTNCVCDTGA